MDKDDSLSDNSKVEVINKIHLKDYLPYIENAISQNQMILIIGEFKVRYEGRASSTIDYGERLLIIKKDKSVLIHQEKGANPINWQPPGNLVNVSFRDGRLMLKVIRRRPREALIIKFTKVMCLQILRIHDRAEFIMDATERQMQEAILRKPDLIFEGFKPVSSEKAVPPGFIDLYGYDKDGKKVIIEIKRVRATEDAVLQLKKYINTYEADAKTKMVRGILVAPEISKAAEKLLAQLGVEFKRIDPRICFEIVKKDKRSKLTDYFI